MAIRRSLSGTVAKQALAKRKTKSTSAQSTASAVEEGIPPPADADGVYASIAARAYALYEERGDRHGYDLQDWLQAERYVLEERRL